MNKYINTKKSYGVSKSILAIMFTSLATFGFMCEEDLPEAGSIEDLTPPESGFTYAIDELDYRIVEFANGSESAIEYLWEFGDGSTDETSSPTHAYAEDGSYKVILTAIDGTGAQDTASMVVLIKDETPPASSFKAIAGLASEYRTVTFSNTSENATIFNWDFGDNSGVSTEENPSYTYAADGTYTVKLVSSDITGQTATSTVEIVVEPIFTPVASFTYEAVSLKVTFTNNSTASTSYVWDFGDGMTSTEENPVHTYADEGNYTVKLTATDGVNPNEFSESFDLAYFIPTIYNPGFEIEEKLTPTSSGPCRCIGWTDSSVAKNAGGTSSKARTGDGAVKIQSGTQRAAYQKLIVEPNASFTVKFWYSASNDLIGDSGAIEGMILSEEITDPSEAAGVALVRTNDLVGTGSQTDYVQVEMTFTSTDDEVWIWVSNGSADPLTDFRIDDFTVERN